MARQGSIERQCTVCGASFRIFPCHLRAGGGIYCSMICQRKGRPRRERVVLTKTCRECGQQFMVRKGYGGTGAYCSNECRAIGNGRRMRADNHPNWKGGKGRLGTEKTVIRRLIRERGACERCGDTSDLQGHHILQRSERPDLAAEPTNIKVLCASCHAGHHPKQAAMIDRGRQRTGAAVSCRCCGEAFYVEPRRVAVAQYCSYACTYAARRGAAAAFG